MEEKQKKRLLWQLPFLTLLVIGTILIIRHQQKMPYRKSADFIFGTSYSVIYIAVTRDTKRLDVTIKF